MAEEKKAKKKRPTALKRDIQNEKRRKRNQVAKSQVRTAVNSYNAALKAGDAASIKEKLSSVYALLDKSVKKGIYKLNKASRLKSRLTKKAS